LFFLEFNTRHRELLINTSLCRLMCSHTGPEKQGRNPMEKSAHQPRQNRILAGLPEPEYQRIASHLEPVDLPSGKIIYDIDQQIDYVYFPFHAMISLVTLMEDGKIVEVGLVGRDGMTGIVALMGQKTSPDRAIVQIPDGAVRARLEVIKEEFARAGSLQSSLLRYAYTLMRQVSQTAACNAAHTAEERLSRWLLMCQDRVQSDELNLTQEFIAEMLATRRATVNVAATNLQAAGFIRYNRGHIHIIDREALVDFSCECYEALNRSINGNGPDISRKKS
jgi:CRP-like cAMP-binding protein